MDLGEVINVLVNVISPDQALIEASTDYINTQRTMQPNEFFAKLVQVAQLDNAGSAPNQALIQIKTMLTPSQYYTPGKIKMFWNQYNPEFKSHVINYFAQAAFSEDIFVAQNAAAIYGQLQRLEPNASNVIFGQILQQLSEGKYERAFILLQVLSENISEKSADLFQIFAKLLELMNTTVNYDENFISIYKTIESMVPIFKTEEIFVNFVQQYITTITSHIAALAQVDKPDIPHVLCTGLYTVFDILYDIPEAEYILRDEKFIGFILANINNNNLYIRQEILYLLIQMTDKEYYNQKQYYFAEKLKYSAVQIFKDDQLKIQKYMAPIASAPYLDFFHEYSNDIIQQCFELLINFGNYDADSFKDILPIDETNIPPHLLALSLIKNIVTLFPDLLDKIIQFDEQIQYEGAWQILLVKLELKNIIISINSKLNAQYLLEESNRNLFFTALNSEVDSVCEFALSLFINAPQDINMRYKEEEIIDIIQRFMPILSRHPRLVLLSIQALNKWLISQQYRMKRHRDVDGVVDGDVVKALMNFINEALAHDNEEFMIKENVFIMYSNVFTSFRQRVYDSFLQLAQSTFSTVLDALAHTYEVSDQTSEKEQLRDRSIYINFIFSIIDNCGYRLFEIAGDLLQSLSKIYESSKDPDILASMARCVCFIYVKQEQSIEYVQQLIYDLFQTQDMWLTFTACRLIGDIMPNLPRSDKGKMLELAQMVYKVLDNQWLIEQTLPVVISAITRISKYIIDVKDSRIEAICSEHIRKVNEELRLKQEQERQQREQQEQQRRLQRQQNGEDLEQEEMREPMTAMQDYKEKIVTCHIPLADCDQATLNSIIPQTAFPDVVNVPEGWIELIDNLLEMILQYNYSNETSEQQSASESVLAKGLSFLETIITRIPDLRFITDRRIKISKFVKKIYDFQITEKSVICNYISFYNSLIDVFERSKLNITTYPLFTKREFIYPIIVANTFDPSESQKLISMPLILAVIQGKSKESLRISIIYQIKTDENGNQYAFAKPL